MSEGTGYEQLNVAVATRDKSIRYTPEIAEKICALVADGKSLRTICDMPGMPERVTVFRWRREHPEFVELYETARKDAADSFADDIQSVSNDPKLDHNHKRIQVDTLKWIASKLKPKSYGDKLAVSGDDEGGPIQISWAKPE